MKGAGMAWNLLQCFSCHVCICTALQGTFLFRRLGKANSVCFRERVSGEATRTVPFVSLIPLIDESLERRTI